MVIIFLSEKKEQRRRKDYADLVMQKFREMEQMEKKETRRDLIDAKTKSHFGAKDRL